MKVYKITNILPVSGGPEGYYTDNLNSALEAIERNGPRILEVLEMTHAEYKSIPATAEAAGFFPGDRSRTMTQKLEQLRGNAE